MSFLYDVPRYLSNYFKCLQISDITLHLPYLISIFLKIFKKKKFNFVLKIIYLSIYYSNIGLDYDNIYTILILFFKNFP